MGDRGLCYTLFRTKKSLEKVGIKTQQPQDHLPWTVWRFHTDLLMLINTETWETPPRSGTLPTPQSKTLQPRRSEVEETAELFQHTDLLSPL